MLVELVNGNLIVTLPLGQRYPSGPGFDYGLTLVYNSNGWDMSNKLGCFNDPLDPSAVYDFVVPEIDAGHNAGFGWSVSLGRLFAPDQEPYNSAPRWLYVSPDGGPHELFQRLHPGSPRQPDTLFSQDGTYLRMTEDGCTGTVPGASGCRKIEFPNGHRHEFRNFGSTDWRLTRIRDGHDNAVEVTYSTANGAPVWTITDSVSTRQIVVDFDADGRVETVKVPTFGGGTGNYVFTYEPATLERPGYLRPGDCVEDSAPASTVATSVLARLVRPDGSYFDFDYSTTSVPLDNYPGGLSTMELPTGGRMEWDYATSEFPSIGSGPSGQAHRVTQKRTYAVREGGTAVGTWSYAYAVQSNPSAPGDPQGTPCYHATTVTDPVGNATKHYFSTAKAGDAEWAMGLPMTFCDPALESNQPGFYSTSGLRVSQEHFEAGTKVREILVEYTADGRSPTFDPRPWNARMVGQRTNYLASNGTVEDWKQVAYSSFDGVGNWRTQTESGTFGPTRTTTTTFAHPTGTLTSDPFAGTTDDFTLPALTDRWLFTRRERVTATQGDDSFLTDFCHDAASGALVSRRLLAGASPATNDLLTVWERDGSGFPTAEKQFGGDSQAVPGGTLCNVDFSSSTPAYERSIAHSFGTRSAVDAVVPDTSTAVVSELDLTIDESTGLPSSSRDSADVTTGFSYDSMGRLIRETPADDAVVNHNFSFPDTGGENPVYYEKTRTVGTNKIAGAYWEYDGLGRLGRHARDVPQSTRSSQDKAYTWNGIGWKTAETTWTRGASTTYSDHDRYGRVGSVSHPRDVAGLFVTTYKYVGDRYVTRKVQVALDGSTADQDVWITEERDHLGRLVAVCDGQTSEFDDTCTGQRTDYSYDALDRLTQVCQRAGSGATCTQTRTFDYDGRGFLVEESHPEIGVGGNGSHVYTYDARGNVLTKDVKTTAADPKLFYTYDPAGRLIRVEEQDNKRRNLKEFRYARSNDGTNRRAGKLVSAKRWNWAQIQSPLSRDENDQEVTVTDRFWYEADGGRISKKVTSVAIAKNHQAWVSSYTYDDLGNVASVTYPQAQTWPLSAEEPARTVSSLYEYGLLESVTGYVDSFGYDLGGEHLEEIRYAGGVTWTQNYDDRSRLPRPNQITFGGLAGDTSESLGAHVYDGTGNLRSIGSIAYGYDAFGRVVSEKLDSASRQLVDFDAYGNITSLWTSGDLAALQPNPSVSTNRIAGLGAEYDERGNLAAINLGGGRVEYTWDGLSKLKYQRTSTHTFTYLYDANDDRVLRWTCAFGQCGSVEPEEHWTLRGLDGEVLRISSGPENRSYQWREDYVYGDGRLLASVDAEKGRRSLLLDHLGSVRRVVTPTGVVERSQDFYAFGQEATTPTSGDPALKYTGHERDEIGPSARSLDYMRARYCSPELGRFLSVDPAAESFDPRSGQSWNRYSYVRNSPLKYHDPDGRIVETIADVGFVVHDLIDIGRTVLNGKEVTPGQKIALAGDILGAALPFATGLGKAGKMLHAADKGGGAGKLLDNAAQNADSVAKSSQDAGEMAADLASNIDRNRVSGTTAGGKRVDIDLQGKGHFDKKTGQTIDTPHVHEADINVGPSGQTNLSNKTTRPAEKSDIRVARRLSEGG